MQQRLSFAPEQSSMLEIIEVEAGIHASIPLNKRVHAMIHAYDCVRADKTVKDIQRTADNMFIVRWTYGR